MQRAVCGMVVLLGVLLLFSGPAPVVAQSCEGDSGTIVGPAEGLVLYVAQPAMILVAEVPAGMDAATVTDVEIADFDGDGRNDIAVAWYATDLQDMLANVRTLSIFFGAGAEFVRRVDLDLYIPDFGFPARSVFRNGTSEIGLGDFDGDHDIDLAVLPFFGDELWFVENLGGGAFAQHLRFPFGFNSTGNFLTPPEALGADFDGDGRDELVYLADPIQYYDGQKVHFWRTDGAIADVYRAYWQISGREPAVQWTRGLAVADFSGDGEPDLCFSGSVNPPYEDDPVLVFWYGLDMGNGSFCTHYEYPSVLCSDVVAVRSDPACPAGVLLTDLNGTSTQYWAHCGRGRMDFEQRGAVTGYAGLSANRGMTGVVADVTGEGGPDLVTKQKLGDAFDTNQIEITVSHDQGDSWNLVEPTPLDTTGLKNYPYNEILRPRNLAVGDLLGNTRPEIVAGCGAGTGTAEAKLELAIWRNSCLGDVNVDGKTDGMDLNRLYGALGVCGGDQGFDADCDLDKDGCIQEEDLSLLIEDLGCVCRDSIPAPCAGQLVGDADCNGVINTFDLDAFAVALCQGEAAWTAQYGGTGCDFVCVNDITGDGRLDCFDVDLFVVLLVHQ